MAGSSIEETHNLSNLIRAATAAFELYGQFLRIHWLAPGQPFETDTRWSAEPPRNQDSTRALDQIRV